MQQVQNNLDVKPKKRFQVSDVISAAVIAALATLAVAGLSVISGKITTNQAREQSCISRIDSQEAIFREKAAILLGSLGDMIGVATATQEDRTAYNSAAQRVIKASYELTAYTGATKLGVNVLKIAASAKRAMSVKTEEQKQQAHEETGSTFADWPALYDEVLSDYEHKRELCRD
ncbi:hypothetical protein ACTJJT_01165 [Pseudomonas sp. 22373]|uniref:hypothetical protein n=1 Tax=Pseudomonas sp. 22373 TaxID=3453914 RepID=UPI001AF8CC6B|nr:hypothetical protein JQN61_04365 [Pseudomonas putida]